MSAPFLFDTDFSDLSPARRTVELTQEALEARLEERAAAAYAQGYADGGTLERNTIAARLSDAVEQLLLRLDALAEEQQRTEKAQQAHAARLAVTLARKLAGRLRSDDPLSALEEAFAALAGDMRGEKTVSVALHPDLVEEARPRLSARAAEALATFTLQLTPDADLPPGDARITWSEGGAILDAAALDARLDAIIARILPNNEETP